MCCVPLSAATMRQLTEARSVCVKSGVFFGLFFFFGFLTEEKAAAVDVQ